MIKPSSRTGKLWFYIVTFAVFLLAFGAAQELVK